MKCEWMKKGLRVAWGHRTGSKPEKFFLPRRDTDFEGQEPGFYLAIYVALTGLDYAERFTQGVALGCIMPAFQA